MLTLRLPSSLSSSTTSFDSTDVRSGMDAAAPGDERCDLTQRGTAPHVNVCCFFPDQPPRATLESDSALDDYSPKARTLPALP